MNNGWYTTEDRAGWETIRTALRVLVNRNPKAAAEEIFRSAMPEIAALAGCGKVRAFCAPAADLQVHRNEMAEIIRQCCSSFPMNHGEGVEMITSEYAFWTTFEKLHFGKSFSDDLAKPESWQGKTFLRRIKPVILEEVFDGYIPS